jgi:hypothetical protein
MFTTKKDIQAWLKSMNIENYSIQDDLIVNVDGDVKIGTKNLTEIPIQFGIINGYFSCYGNKLTSLKGGPTKVKGYFNCSGNNLKSLQYCPIEVGDCFFANSNQIESLEYSPLVVGGSFACGYNPIKNLQGFTTSIARNFEHEVASINDCITELKPLYQWFETEYDMKILMLILNKSQIESIQLAQILDEKLINNSLQITKKTKV